MASELYLVRHGRTMFNEKAVIQGWCDAPLTPEGEEQAVRVGRYLAREGIAFDRAFTSTLTRTHQTIERITDIPYERLEGLREWGFGAYEGERVSLMPPFPWGDFFVPFGGEGQLQVRRRVSRAMADAMGRSGEGARVLAVSHGSACREFLTQWAADQGYGRPGVGVPGNCSIMHFTYEDGSFTLQEVLEQDDLKRMLGE